MEKGVIQNEDCITKALFEGREFVLICENEKDAHSKRVSLYNARRRLTIADQKKITIKKEFVNGQHVVRILKSKPSIMEVVNGEMIPFVELIDLSESSKAILKDMLNQGVNEEAIVEVLVSRGEEEESIRAEIIKCK
jgi:hypothetical protein